MKRIIITMLPVFMLMFSGCCKMLKSEKQAVKFITVPAGATVEVDGNKVCKTPCSANIARANEHKVVLTLNDKKMFNTRLVQKPDVGTMFANVFNGLVPGIIIDAASGSMYDLEPSTVYHTFDGLSAEGIESVDSTKEIMTYQRLLSYNESSWDSEINELKSNDYSLVVMVANSKIYACDPSREKYNVKSDLSKTNSEIDKREVRLLDKLCKAKLLNVK